MNADSEEAVFRSLLAGLPRAYGAPRWDLADPYLRRHAAEHAARAGPELLVELLSDREYLVNADAWSVASALSPFRDAYPRMTRQILDVYCASISWHQRVGPRARRQILALDALRLGHRELAASMERMPGGAPLPWHCVWSTATNISASAGATMTGHAESINAMTVVDVGGTPMAVTGSRDRTARVWDLTQGRARHVLLHTAPVTCVATAEVHARPILLTGGDRLYQWDLLTGRPVSSVSVGSTLRQIAVDPSGLVVLATAGYPYMADLHAQPMIPRPVPGAGRGVRFVAVCREGSDRFGLCVSEGSYLTAFTLPHGRVLHRTVPRRVAESADRITAVSVKDIGDQTLAILGHASGACTVVHARSGTVLASLTHPGVPRGRPPRMYRGSVDALAIQLTGSGWIAAAGHHDGTLRIWDLGSGESLGEVPAHAGPITEIAITSVENRSMLLTASEDDTIRCWDVETGTLILRDVLAGHTSDVIGAVPTTVENRPVAVTVSKDLTVRTWDLRSPRPPAELAGHPNWVRSLQLHRIAGHLYAVTTCRDPIVRVLDAVSGNVALELEEPEGRPLQTASVCTVDGATLIAAGGEQGAVNLWDSATRRLIDSDSIGSALINAIAVHVHPGGDLQIIVGANDGSVSVWHPNTSRPVRLLSPPRRDAGIASLAVATMPSGAVIITGDFDGTYQALSLDSGRLMHRRDHPAAIKAMAIGDIAGTRCTAAGDDTGQIVLRNLSDATVLRTLHGHTAAVRSVAFSKVDHDEVLISCSTDGTVRIWDAATGAQIHRIDLPDFVQTVAYHDGALAIGYGREVSVFTRAS
ncbi:WD40 repeat domain-containing protein [Streptomyces sp. NPDC049954]|uniref:WD40 repeat domain-containing protein n=1 Tax=Streptomyces sp. NPDC049954 TaxID=3155779 RepID=UPI0034410D64